MNAELAPDDFSRFFRAIHGHTPFPWQQKLVDLLARTDKWPEVLDLPTGSGKTAALDAAVFHLALRAETPGKAALRIALVVDRRIVVDDAFERARKIARALADPEDEVVEKVAGKLRSLSEKSRGQPLIAKRLRGGAPLENDWALTPTQPTILCSTVDQIGSRLLFRGYGVSDRMKPVHAGLLGKNSLILLDEAHLSEPFRQTLDAVRKHGEAAVGQVLLTATPKETRNAWGLSREDREHPVLKKRLEADKPAKLRALKRGQEPAEAFAEAARRIGNRLLEAGKPAPAVGVVVNRVDLARAIHTALSENEAFDAILMIGRSRDTDRDRIVQKLRPFHTGAEGRSGARPLYVIATQCLEVGVDLDLDGLVTQAAPLDALRQRFGRLNRAGRDVLAEGEILVLAENLDKRKDDPIYGDRIRATWDALSAIASNAEIDFGAAAMENLGKRLRESDNDPAKLTASPANAPVLMPAYLDLWAQTSPVPNADPEVGLFLHGANRPSADVSLVWRGDLDHEDMTEERTDFLKKLLRTIPPRSSEMVQVPLWAARAWLLEASTGVSQSDPVADIPTPDPEENRSEGVNRRRAFRWAGDDNSRTKIVAPVELRPGDVLVVPGEYGGCDEFGWAPEFPGPARDVADRAAEPFRGRRHAVRIARDSVREDHQWDRITALLDADDGADPTELIEKLLDALPGYGDTEPESSEADAQPIRSIREPLEALRDTEGRIRIVRPYPEGSASEKGAILVAERGLRLKSNETQEIAMPSTESDEGSHTSARAVSLDDHGRDVADQTRSFADLLGLDPHVVEDLALAAFLHDAGKADRRFQSMLAGGDPWNRPDDLILAKSRRTVPRGAWNRSGLPGGWRHEALSVRMALSHSRFAEAHDPALVLWLIGTHHGLGRPFFGFVEDRPQAVPAPCLGMDEWRLDAKPGPQSLAFDYRGSDWPTLFDQLKRKYGIWGLAHFEAILRLADHRASEAEGRS